MSEIIGLSVEGPEEVQFNPEELRLVEAVSPTVQVERNEDGVMITVHDLNGTRTAQLFNGIGSVVKTGSDGLVDTYTITWKDGTTSTLNLTNGKGIAGVTLNVDYTLTLSMNDGTSVTVGPIRGEKGEKGDDADPTVLLDDTAGDGDTGHTWTADKLNDEFAGVRDDIAKVEPLNRVTSLDATELACGTPIETVGIPVYVNDVTNYPEFNLTETGWYIFARIHAKDGITVSAETSVAGAAGVIKTIGAAYIDVAVRFEVAALSKKIVVTWAAGNTETFIFKSTDLAVRNIDYRTTFYVYDILDYVTWTYALTTDTTFVTGSRYFTESGGEYTEAIEGTDWTAGGTIPANTYYKHSKLTFAGMIRNVTYRLNEMVDCPIEISLPTVPDDGYGAWFEIQMRFNAQYSITLVPTDNTVKIGTATTQSLTEGINVVDLTYSAVNEIKMWTLLNTHSNIPTT